MGILITNLAVSWYNVAVIWLMQLDIYPSWAYVPSEIFGRLQGMHFYQLFLTVYPQAILATVLSFVMLRRRPTGVARPLLVSGVVIQCSLWLLTALLWGRWQGQIALPTSTPTPALGPANTALYETLVQTHWLRVALITAYALIASTVVRAALKEARTQ
ncbi:MAG TPA: hypothetical protein VF234_04815 [Limnochordia bacterium]